MGKESTSASSKNVASELQVFSLPELGVSVEANNALEAVDKAKKLKESK